MLTKGMIPVRQIMAALATGALLASTGPARAGLRLIRPSEVDPAIVHYDEPNVVIADGANDTPPLVVFLPGTEGRPQNVLPLLRVAADQGYRVIGLSYDNVPAVEQVCPADPDPTCSLRFRATRTLGERGGPVANPLAEAIVPRLAALLRHLVTADPREHWDAYLDAAGQPRWDRLVLAGFSQGAGMAALLAKRFAVYRVVLFSSPWDTTGADRRPAPWLAMPSATPLERWWAERHVRERTTRLIGNAYTALSIPVDHILLIDTEPRRPRPTPNPYHGSTVANPDNAPAWRTLFGRP